MIRDLDPLPYHVGAYGPGLIVHGELGGHMELVERAAVRELTWSAVAPTELPPLDALAEVDGLLGLRLVTPNRPLGKDDWQALRACPQLRYLSIWQHPLRGRLPLGQHPELEWLRISDHKGVTFDPLPRLRGLVVTGWAGRDLFAGEVSLERLDLLRPRQQDLRALPSLENLRSLSLYAGRGMASLDGIERFAALEELELHGFGKDLDCSALAELPNLRRLRIDNCRNVRGLRLGDLEALWFVGESRLADGDLRWILDCPRLRHAVIAEPFASQLGALPKVYFENNELPLSCPSILFQEPAVRPYAGIRRIAFGKHLQYPHWFRLAHPELCVGDDDQLLPRPTARG